MVEVKYSLILAGGEGTRLKPYSDVIPKPLMPVGGVPCIRRIVERHISFGLIPVILIAGPHLVQLYRHEFRDLKKVKYVVERKKHGTAGDAVRAIKKLHLENEYVLIANGDDLTDINLYRLMDEHKSYNIATVAGIDQYQFDVGIIYLKELGQVGGFKEKPIYNGIVHTGPDLFSPSAYKYVKDGDDISKDWLPKMLEDGKQIGVYVEHTPWVDIGNIYKLEKANERFIHTKTHRG